MSDPKEVSPVSPPNDSPVADPSFSKLQKAAELLKISKFANAPAQAPAPAPRTRVIVSPVAAPEPKAPEPTPAPAAAVAPAVAPPVPAPSSSDKSDRTVPDPMAQTRKMEAPDTSGPGFSELKRQALARAQQRNPTESRLAMGVGTELQEYVVEWTLGVGGFGITYLAMDTNLETEVAIKEYFPADMCSRDADGKVLVKHKEEEGAFKEGLDKFLKECRVLANFKHSNVVRVSRFFQSNNTAYMVMDYESGESFKDWMTKKRVIPEDQLIKMLLPLLDGLEVVHAAGFLHRDIKPGNIYVREDGSMVLLDFGAARHAIGNMSRSLTTIVTPGYAPFEQYHSHGKQGPWTDLYAVGGVLYWTITGSKPSEAPARIKADAMKPASVAAQGRYSPAFLAAIDWALTPNENNRPQSVAAFKEALTKPGAAPTNAAAAPAVPPGKPAPAIAGRASVMPKPAGSQDEKKAWWKPW